MNDWQNSPRENCVHCVLYSALLLASLPLSSSEQPWWFVSDLQDGALKTGIHHRRRFGSHCTLSHFLLHFPDICIQFCFNHMWLCTCGTGDTDCGSWDSSYVATAMLLSIWGETLWLLWGYPGFSLFIFILLLHTLYVSPRSSLFPQVGPWWHHPWCSIRTVIPWLRQCTPCKKRPFLEFSLLSLSSLRKVWPGRSGSYWQHWCGTWEKF